MAVCSCMYKQVRKSKIWASVHVCINNRIMHIQSSNIHPCTRMRHTNSNKSEPGSDVAVCECMYKQQNHVQSSDIHPCTRMRHTNSNKSEPGSNVAVYECMYKQQNHVQHSNRGLHQHNRAIYRIQRQVQTYNY